MAHPGRKLGVESLAQPTPVIQLPRGLRGGQTPPHSSGHLVARAGLFTNPAPSSRSPALRPPPGWPGRRGKRGCPWLVAPVILPAACALGVQTCWGLSPLVGIGTWSGVASSLNSGISGVCEGGETQGYLSQEGKEKETVSTLIKRGFFKKLGFLVRNSITFEMWGSGCIAVRVKLTLSTPFLPGVVSPRSLRSLGGWVFGEGKCFVYVFVPNWNSWESELNVQKSSQFALLGV